MKRRALCLLLFVAVVVTLLALSGCAAILEIDKLLESPHPGQLKERPPAEEIEVSGFDELVAEILGFVMRHESSGRIYAYSYDGDIAADVKRACREIMNDYPVVAYAVSDITGNTTRIVSYYEIDIVIEYQRTKQQVDSIVNVSTTRFLGTELLNVISDYNDEAVIRTALSITEQDVIDLVRETYYQNPRRIVMMPVTAVETYPPGGDDRIFELRFGYIEQAAILRHHGVNLALYVRSNAELAVGENDAEILLSLAENLIAACTYDSGAARAISVHGAQNFAATAYGALVGGSAVGEGFAMAFKALCDELGFDCVVVLGQLDGMIHAWNIVSLNGDHYHIDVAMCALNGIETAFLKNDAAFVDIYSWETDIRCKGAMTYEDIVGPPEVTDDNPDDDVGDGTGEETGDGAAGESDGDTAEASDSSNEKVEETSDPLGEGAAEASDGKDDDAG